MASESSPSLPSTYEGLYEQAMQRARRGDDEGASEILQRILQRLSRLSKESLAKHDYLANFAVDVSFRLAGIQASEKRYQEAIDILQKAKQFAPEEEDALDNNIAMLYISAGDYDKANEISQALVEEFPLDSDHWRVRGHLLFSEGKLEDAEAAYEQAIAQGVDEGQKANAWVWLFRLYSQQKLTEKVMEAWDTVAALEPETAQAIRSELYAYLMDVGEMAALRRYLSSDSDSPRANYYRGLIATKEGNFEEGLSRWRRLVKENPFESEFGRLEWIEAALRTGEVDKALVVVTSNVRETPTPRSIILAAVAAIRKEMKEEARKLLETGTEQLERSIPRRTLYNRQEWNLLTSLVDDREALEAVKHLFAVVEIA